VKGKLRIAMLSWESLYSVKVGGLAPHVSELAEALALKGHEIHIFSRNQDMDRYELVNGVHYHRVNHSLFGGIVQQMNSMCDAMYCSFIEAKDKFGPFDIVHAHDWHPVNLACRLKWELDIPFVITYHSTEWGRNGNVHGDWWEAIEISHIEWKGGYESGRVIITSNEFKKEVQHLYQIPDYKIDIIANGLNEGTAKMAVDPGEIKKNYDIHPYAPVVLFVGRMSYQKGPDILSRAIPMVLEQRWDVKFVFVGEGEMRPVCENIIRELNVQNSCHFLGYVSDQTKKEWINACNLMCVPSRNEPFGIVLLEAWDASKNIVATDAVELIDNFENGITVYQSPESIAWGINHVFANYADGEMGRKGNKLLSKKYNWNTIADETVNTYMQILP